MTRLKLVATDVDGTITVRRGSLLLSIEAVEAIRELERNGIKVSLVSGNSVPVTAGLSRYVGATGPTVAENGCVVFSHGRIYHVCKGRPSSELVERIKELGFRESWQNAFRFHDLAFLHDSKEEMAALIPEVEKIVQAEGMRILWSGYAIHIQPPNGGKGRGLKFAAELAGVRPSEIAAVGDGDNDADMFEIAAFRACPSDASEGLKRLADYVASRPGGAGFAEVARYILRELGFRG
ncbi:MAG: phosphoglycolate phosphatase [Desulfurococcales archaeon]|nr:phosphoglycolate phosphatase [Desulfurococcales archaeon]